jgi:hypothetical protein
MSSFGRVGQEVGHNNWYRVRYFVVPLMVKVRIGVRVI